MATSKQAEAFWRFSLMVYGRPGITTALIGLQDRGGHNVNLILFGLWLAVARGRRLDATGLARARAAIENLDRAAVQPLRTLRRALRDIPDPDIRELRKRVLALEVAAERRIQGRLAASVTGRVAKARRAALAEANLRLILGADFASREGKALSEALARL
ncbi:MAG TPA: TIGR02444 family protein [Stellaceae bacterium]|nr:TIGR02444 family protein [Stellaceae bacterium]